MKRLCQALIPIEKAAHDLSRSKLGPNILGFSVDLLLLVTHEDTITVRLKIVVQLGCVVTELDFVPVDDRVFLGTPEIARGVSPVATGLRRYGGMVDKGEREIGKKKAGPKARPISPCRTILRS